MKFSDQITFVIFTFNEEVRIERAVRNLVGAGRVLVVDNHSVDSTREIAERHGATVLMHRNPGWVEDEHTVSVVKAAVRTPWIYWGFADEMLDQVTLDAVVEAVDAGTCDIVGIVRKNYYYGAFCHDAASGPTNRAFRKEAIDFTGNQIHHFGKPAVPESRILLLDDKRHFVHHFISNTAKTYLRSMDGYTDIESRRDRPLGAGRTLMRMLKTFVNNYVLRKGYKAGLPGLYMVIQSVYYEALVNMKRYETAHQLSFDTIEVANNQARDRILAELR